MSTPRPSGDHARTPRPTSLAHGRISLSADRLRSEYSFWVTLNGIERSKSVNARAVCHPEKFESPIYRTRPLDTANSNAVNVSSRGTDSSHLWTIQISRYSVRNLRRDSSRSLRRLPRELLTPVVVIPALLQITTDSRGVRVFNKPPMTRSLSPSPKMAAVSMRVPP